MRKIMIVLLGVFISSCSCKKDAGKMPVGSLEGNWELTEITGAKMTFERLYPNAKPTLNFNINDTKLTGKNGCNNYGGNFSLDGPALDIDEKTLFSTKMFCEGDGEKTFMDALGKATAYLVSDDGTALTLLNGKTVLLKFKKA